jgi:hypothetical protein
VASRRFGRPTVEAIHYFKNNKPQTIAILKKCAKTDLTMLDSAYAYLKNAIPDLPYPMLEGMKTILAGMGPHPAGSVEIRHGEHDRSEYHQGNRRGRVFEETEVAFPTPMGLVFRHR